MSTPQETTSRRRWLAAGAVATVLLLLLLAAAVSALGLLLLIGGPATSAAATGCVPAGSIADAGGPVRVPVVGSYTVTSEFGMRHHPKLGVYRLHAGIDMVETMRGGPIVSAKAGVVTEVPPTSASAGNIVRIDHGGGVSTRYLHLASRTVSVGQQVAAGQQIGTQGSTGNTSTGEHLHFEVVQGGTPINPRGWFTTHGITLPGLRQPATAPEGTPVSTAASPSPTANVGTGLPAAVGDYRGQQLQIAATIITTGQRMGLDQWTLTAGLTAGMAESSLRNLAHGDTARNDTIGVFQIGPEHGSAADRMDPAWSAQNFFSRLTAVAGYRELTPTIAIHRAQRNDDPTHYTKYWPAAQSMLAALTGDPTILEGLPATGNTSACDPAVMGAEIPPGPDGECPTTGSPVENGLQPVALRGLRCVAKAFPMVKTYHGIGTRPGASDHPSGKAIDAMVENYRTPTGRAHGWRIAHWVQDNATNLNIKYVIFDEKIWHAGQPPQWQPYTRYKDYPNDDTLQHRDHVHISFAS